MGVVVGSGSCCWQSDEERSGSGMTALGLYSSSGTHEKKKKEIGGQG